MKPEILHIENLVDATAQIAKTVAHPAGIKIMALKAVHEVIMFWGVDPKTANVVKQEMLSRGGDAAVSKTVGMLQDAETDMILMGTLAQCVRLIRKLRKQTYNGCIKVADALEDLLFKDFDLDTKFVS